MTESEFERLRTVARRFDQKATAYSEAIARATTDVDLKQFLDGKREAFAEAAYAVREELDKVQVVSDVG
jgi:hypothetical protein